MTSASELFYQRRSRVGRVTADTEFEPSSSDRLFHSRRHHHGHTHRRDFDGCDPIRRSRNPCHRLSSVPERAPIRVDQATSQSSINTESLSSSSSSTYRARLTGNELPGAVLLARARLVERLRGVSSSANRRSNRVSFDSSNRDFTFIDNLQTITSSLSTRIINQTERSPQSHKNKPPGLTSKDIDSLQLEVFCSLEEKGKTPHLSRDCSICLESFEEGEKLINLPCEHRFHAVCLDRWIRTCGDCPYCRRDIVVSNHFG